MFVYLHLREFRLECRSYSQHPQCYDQALEKHLAPRLRITGGSQALEEFGAFINQQALDKGTNIYMLWQGSDNLEVTVKPIEITDVSKVALSELMINERQDLSVCACFLLCPSKDQKQ